MSLRKRTVSTTLSPLLPNIVTTKRIPPRKRWTTKMTKDRRSCDLSQLWEISTLDFGGDAVPLEIQRVKFLRGRFFFLAKVPERCNPHGAWALVAYLIWHCLFRMQDATMLIPQLYALHVLWSKAVSKASNFSSRQRRGTRQQTNGQHLFVVWFCVK